MSSTVSGALLSSRLRGSQAANLPVTPFARSPGESRLWLIHNRGERCASGVQNCCSEKEKSEFPAGKPGHPRRGAPQTATGIICQGMSDEGIQHDVFRCVFSSLTGFFKKVTLFSTQFPIKTV